MNNNEIAFAIFYGAIAFAGLCVALHYWYYELYKKREMKLYAFQPNGHGEASFFTIAKNEESAKKAVNKYVEDNYLKDGKLDYRAAGWGSDYYTLTVIEEGNVIENDND